LTVHQRYLILHLFNLYPFIILFQVYRTPAGFSETQFKKIAAICLEDFTDFKRVFTEALPQEFIGITFFDKLLVFLGVPSADLYSQTLRNQYSIAFRVAQASYIASMGAFT